MSNNIGKKSGMNWLALLLLSILIAATAGAAYLSLPVLLPQTSTDIVMIRAEQGPFKVKPVDPGGKIITNQESKVMNMLGDLSPKMEEVETLLPPLGAPELPPVTVETTPRPETVEANDNDSETNVVASIETDGKTAASTAPDNGATTKLVETDTRASRKNEGYVVPAAPATEKPSQTVDAITKPMKPAGKPIATPRVISDANEPAYLVQLAAFRNESVAAEQTGLLFKKHEKRLLGATMRTIRVDTGDNGIFWRVVSEPLPREAADIICASLKRAGQDCILRKFKLPSQ